MSTTSIQASDSFVTGTAVAGGKQALDVNIAATIGVLVPTTFDFITLTPGTLTDVWKYYAGGSGGTLVATVTITYTDSTKATIASVGRT